MHNEPTRRQHARATMLLFACLIFGFLMLASPATALAEDPNNGIPVLYISLVGVGEESPSDAFDAINQSPDHSVERAGTMRLDVPEGYTGDYSTSELADLNNLTLEYMRGRGNSTWVQDKKPYKIKLEKSTDLLGMGANKHWALLANSMDTSMLRNRIASFIGSELGAAFTPKMLPVDLVVNGEYHGSYFLSELVRIGKTRVNIDELSPSDTEEPAITGGYLLAMTPKADEPVENRITTEHGIQFCGDSPDFGPNGSGTDAQKDYIASYLQRVEDAIYGDDLRDANGIRWTDYMDQTSIARYWWVQEFLANSPDAFWTPSTYLYKVREGKLYWGPLWDFDQAMASGTSGLRCTSTPWLDYLRSFDSAYQQELRSTWTELDAVIESVVREGGVLDQYANEMQQSWQDDFELWVKGKPHEPYAKSFEEEVENLRAWLSARRVWINDNIDQELTHVMCKVTYEVDGTTVATECIYAGQGIITLPAWPKKEGKVFLGWATQDGSMLDDDATFESSTTVTAVFADAKDVQLGDGIFLNCYELWTSLDDSPYQTRFTIVPYNSQEKYATWTSSNEGVATVDAYGVVTPRAVGDAVITCTLVSGASSSYTLHVVESQAQISTDVSSIELDRAELELKQGTYGQVRANVMPQANTLVLPSYRSRDEHIATVDENGVVKAVSVGTTTIEVHYPGSEDGENPRVSYEVVVSDAEPASSAEQDPSTKNDEGRSDGGAQTTSRVGNKESASVAKASSSTKNASASSTKTPQTEDVTFIALPRIVCAIAFILLLVGLLTKRSA